MATLYKTDGTKSEVKPKNGKDFSLEELQYYVEGYIEHLYIDDETYMIVNEEGKLRGIEINKNATVLYRQARRTSDYIVGNAIVCRQEDIL